MIVEWHELGALFAGKANLEKVAGTEVLDGNNVSNGGQIYAECYFWVYDQDGNWYVMIEIEQEGSGDDYFTFYTGSGYSAPEPGTELTVHSVCNVTSNWISFENLVNRELRCDSGTVLAAVTAL